MLDAVSRTGVHISNESQYQFESSAFARFEVPIVFGKVTPYRLVGRCLRNIGTYRLQRHIPNVSYMYVLLYIHTFIYA